VVGRVLCGLVVGGLGGFLVFGCVRDFVGAGGRVAVECGYVGVGGWGGACVLCGGWLVRGGVCNVGGQVVGVFSSDCGVVAMLVRALLWYGGGRGCGGVRVSGVWGEGCGGGGVFVVVWGADLGWVVLCVVLGGWVGWVVTGVCVGHGCVVRGGVIVCAGWCFWLGVCGCVVGLVVGDCWVAAAGVSVRGWFAGGAFWLICGCGVGGWRRGVEVWVQVRAVRVRVW